MRSINKVILIGHLAADPEVRATKNGTKVANFPLATNRDWVVNGGDKARVATDYHKIVAWKLAEIVEKYVTKGMAIYVEGRLMNRAFVLPDKTKRYVTEIHLDQLNILEFKKKGTIDQVNLKEVK
jgi:single-strand DNA-binding protein